MKVSESQFSFMPRGSPMEANFLLWRLIEKYREKRVDLPIAFINLEKVYDRVSRKV